MIVDGLTFCCCACCFLLCFYTPNIRPCWAVPPDGTQAELQKFTQRHLTDLSPTFYWGRSSQFWCSFRHNHLSVTVVYRCRKLREI